VLPISIIVLMGLGKLVWMVYAVLGTMKGYVYQEIGNTQEGNLARGHGQYRRVYRLFSVVEPFSFRRKQLWFP
jgi:hypothetical protein